MKMFFKKNYPIDVMFSQKRLIIWMFIVFDQIFEYNSTKGCITILKQPKSKTSICTNYETGFTRIPEKFPDFITDLSIENQKINSIDSSQLRHLPYMLNLTLNNNNIAEVLPNAFAYLPQLVSLKLSGNNLYLRDASLPSSSFIYLKSLKVLDLSKNPLGFVPDYYFQSLKQLNVLILSGAQKGFFIEENGFYGLTNLQVLDLSYTHLTTLSDGLSQSFSMMQLHGLYLYKNPWNCDCNLQWLKMWFTRYKSVKYSKDLRKEMKLPSNVDVFPDTQPECHEPANVQGKNLLSNSGDSGSIGIMDFKCPPNIFTKDRKVDITKGQNLTLTCDLHANPGGSVVWSKNGMVVQKHWPRISWSISQGIKFKAWLNIFDVEESDAGNWRCILTTSVGKVSATFSVKVIGSGSFVDYKYILKYVGIGGVTIILLLVVIGIIIYCIYGFQIQNNRRRKPPSKHDKVILNKDTDGMQTTKNYRIIARANDAVSMEDQILSGQYYSPSMIGNPSSVIQPCMEQSHSPFSHYLVNGTSAVCPLHGDINKKLPEQSETSEPTYKDSSNLTMKMPLVECLGGPNANVPCPIHGNVLSYLSTSESQISPVSTLYSSREPAPPMYSRSADEYILRVSSCNPTTIMTTGPLIEDIKYLSSVPDSTSFSFSAAI